MADIIFRPVREEDIASVNSFYNDYHHAGRSLERFRWEFQQGPHGPGIYVLALHSGSGEILGIQAGIPVILLDPQGKEILTVKSEDTLLDVDACSFFRGRDVFKELYSFFIEECRKRGATCIWGFTWVIKSLKRVGCEFPFRAGQMILIFKPLSSYRFLSGLNKSNTGKEKAMILGMTVFSWLRNALYTFGGSSPKGITLDRNVTGNTSLFSLIARNEPLHFIKQDEPYLQWRTKDNPYTLKYEIFNFREGNLLRAQIISSMGPGKQAFIEQMLFDPGLTRSVRLSMIRRTLKDLRKAGASHVRFMVFEANKINSAEAKLLHNTGFLKLRPGMGFLFIRLADDNTPDPGSFLLSRLYTQGHS